MAILEGPLFGAEATGKIRSTVTFFPRNANLECTDEEEKAWYHLSAITYRREGVSPARQAQKEKFKQGTVAWHALSPEEQSAWEEQATGLQTPFNAFISDYLLTH